MKRRKECLKPKALEFLLQKVQHLPRRYVSLLLAAGLLSLSPMTLAGPFPAALRTHMAFSETEKRAYAWWGS